MTPEPITLAVTGTERTLCQLIAERQQRGVAKYGTTLADNPTGLRGWLQHQVEEQLDAAAYAARAIADLDALVKFAESKIQSLAVESAEEPDAWQRWAIQSKSEVHQHYRDALTRLGAGAAPVAATPPAYPPAAEPWLAKLRAAGPEGEKWATAAVREMRKAAASGAWAGVPADLEGAFNWCCAEGWIWWNRVDDWCKNWSCYLPAYPAHINPETGGAA